MYNYYTTLTYSYIFQDFQATVTSSTLKPAEASPSFDNPPTSALEFVPSPAKSTSSDSEGIYSSNTGSAGTLQRYPCLFCCMFEKKVGFTRVFPATCMSSNEKGQLLKAATALNDLEMIDKISSSDDLHYHINCCAAYKLKNRRANEDIKINTDWHTARDIYKTAFEALSAFITREILKKQKVMYLADLNARYKVLA